jgi:hypothetical protein
MADEPLDESGELQSPVANAHSVGWCDPRLCQPDAIGVPGRWHYAIGAAIALTRQDEVQLAGGLNRPTLHVIADQHHEDEPTYCLYSEWAKASSRSGHRGMDVVLSRQEAEQLRDELTRWLDVTHPSLTQRG